MTDDASNLECPLNSTEKLLEFDGLLDFDFAYDNYISYSPCSENYVNSLTKIYRKFWNKCTWLMHYNIQGLRTFSKFEEFKQILNSCKLDLKIICLNEHWLKESELCLLQDNFADFKLANSYCREKSLRGGSCILIRNDIHYKLRNDLIASLKEDFVFEVCCVEFVDLNNVSHIVISLYRNPDQSNMNCFLNKLERLLSRLKRESKTKEIYIASDLNIDSFKTCRNQRITNILLNLMETHGFNLNFHFPTRITSHSKSCIDNIFSNKLVTQRYLMNVELGISDHRALLITLHDNSNKQCPNNFMKKRCFTESSLNCFAQSLKEIEWNFDGSKSSQKILIPFFRVLNSTLNIFFHINQ